MKRRSQMHYSRQAFDPKQIRKTLRELAKDVEFDTVVATGVSGLMAAPVLAQIHRARNINMVAVRKTTAGCHSSEMVEGDMGSVGWVFVDDFISSGDTLRRVYEQVLLTWPGTKFVGAVLYGDEEFVSGRYLTRRYGLDQPIPRPKVKFEALV